MSAISIVFIGAGNLATNLAKALYRKGYRITQVYSRTEEAARALAETVEADYTTRLEGLQAEASLYIVSLKDAAFVELLPEIVAGKEKGLWVHTAGSISMSVWEGYVKRYGVLYPMQTFSKQCEVDFQHIPFFIEASNRKDAEYLKSIASTLSNKVYEADSEQRKGLHLAAVFTCNFVNHLYALGADLLEKYNLSFDTMLPLIDETARKVHELPPREAQTGPAVRHDENVMNKHLELLADEPKMQEIYRLLSESIHDSGN
ncbi:Glutamyl-tRNA reductase [termite gut metagenome]|uniref:Glutamyl-tRNA reductase n=1 Tax=termite gut metagenome TaxID=433724 RepID=A0A5J4SZV6_9ZZZZ